MSWDSNTRPKRLRRRQKKFLLTLTFIISMIFVALLGIFDGFSTDGGLKIIADVADSILSDDEKRVVWEGMSKEGKDVLRKHIPVPGE